MTPPLVLPLSLSCQILGNKLVIDASDADLVLGGTVRVTAPDDGDEGVGAGVQLSATRGSGGSHAGVGAGTTDVAGALYGSPVAKPATFGSSGGSHTTTDPMNPSAHLGGLGGGILEVRADVLRIPNGAVLNAAGSSGFAQSMVSLRA